MNSVAARADDDSAGHGVDRVAELAQRHPGLVWLGRAGWLAKGLVYGVAGVLALSIALDRGSSSAPADGASGGQEASQTGAVAKIAESSGGSAALWVLAIGLALYVLWRIVTIFLPAEDSVKVWATRAGYVVSVVTYSSLAWFAASVAQHHGGSRASDDSRVEGFTADVLGHSGGRWIVGAVGLVIIAVGLVFAQQGVSGDFAKELEPRDVGPVRHRAVVQVGRIGWCGRAVMMGLIGFFLVRAAVRFDPSEAEGLDGALRRLVDTGWGAFVVAATGAGLLLYGLYCVISTPIRRLLPAG